MSTAPSGKTCGAAGTAAMSSMFYWNRRCIVGRASSYYFLLSEGVERRGSPGDKGSEKKAGKEMGAKWSQASRSSDRYKV